MPSKRGLILAGTARCARPARAGRALGFNHIHNLVLMWRDLWTWMLSWGSSARLSLVMSITARPALLPRAPWLKKVLKRESWDWAAPPTRPPRSQKSFLRLRIHLVCRQTGWIDSQFVFKPLWMQFQLNLKLGWSSAFSPAKIIIWCRNIVPSNQLRYTI